MTIDMENFEMTLEVLGDGEEACEFFKTFEKETRKDLDLMRKYMMDRNWSDLKRICHTWKGRNAQIGFRKSSHLAASLHDFLQQCAKDQMGECGMIVKQVEMFVGTLEKECEEINSFLRSQYLL